MATKTTMARVTVLLVEDNPGDERLMRELARELPRYDLCVAGTLAEALSTLAVGPPDLVLLDLGLPDSEGLATLRAVIERAPGIPVVVLTGLTDDEVALEAIRQGAQDYLVKGRLEPSAVDRAIRYGIERSRAVAQPRTEEERRRAVETLTSSDSLFQKVFEILPVGLWLADEKGRLLRGNPEGVRIWGAEPLVDPAEYGVFKARRMPSGEELGPEDWALFKTVRDGVTVVDELLEIDAFDGVTRTILNYTAPVRDDDGRLRGAIVVNNDVTERFGLQEQLRQSQKMEAVGRLAGGVAHDFNNLLSVILGYTEDALANLPPESALAQDLQQVCLAAERSADLTRQLLAFSRRQTIAPRVVDLNVVLRNTGRLLQRILGEDVTLSLVLPVGLWPVRLDPSQVDQIVANLAVNARDAMQDGGGLTVETANVTLDRPLQERYGAALPPGDYVSLEVRDEGCGMDEGILAHLFEPLFTTKPPGKGTGLGLATVYGIVRQNEGAVSVESLPGGGTTVTVFFPRHRGEAPGLAEAKPEAPPRGRETILLVEDEDLLRRLAQKLLEREGYVVLAMAGPEEAIFACSHLDGALDLVLTDVVMPSMNGRELADLIRKVRPGVRVLFMSGYTSDVIATRGILDEGVDFLQKPFTRDALLRRVREVLDGR